MVWFKWLANRSIACLNYWLIDIFIDWLFDWLIYELMPPSLANISLDRFLNKLVTQFFYSWKNNRPTGPKYRKKPGPSGRMKARDGPPGPEIYNSPASRKARFSKYAKKMPNWKSPPSPIFAKSPARIQNNKSPAPGRAGPKISPLVQTNCAARQ